MGENHDTPTLKIGELAKRLGLNVRTLRYYESIGLLSPTSRSEGNYRLYSEADERRLRFVLQAKRVGLSLEEIARILELGRHGSACDYVQQTVARHIGEIDEQIASLTSLRGSLSELMTRTLEPDEQCAGEVCALIERETFPSSIPAKEVNVTSQVLNVEVFTAGCPVCDPVVQLVKQVACPSCDVTVYNLADDPRASERAKTLGIERLPTVLVDGKPLTCCEAGPVTEAALRAAGVGRA